MYSWNCFILLNIQKGNFYLFSIHYSINYTTDKRDLWFSSAFLLKHFSNLKYNKYNTHTLLVHAVKPCPLYSVKVTTDILTRRGKDIAFADYNTLWRSHRRLVQSSFALFGEGSGKLQTIGINTHTCTPTHTHKIKQMNRYVPHAYLSSVVVNKINWYIGNMFITSIKKWNMMCF